MERVVLPVPESPKKIAVFSPLRSVLAEQCIAAIPFSGRKSVSYTHLDVYKRQELIRTQGGYTLVADHHVYDTLELPVMGLMSDAGFQYSHRKLERMIRKAHEMGVPDAMAPFITLSFMALPVIPEIRVTPRGIYLSLIHI